MQRRFITLIAFSCLGCINDFTRSGVAIWSCGRDLMRDAVYFKVFFLPRTSDEVGDLGTSVTSESLRLTE